MLYPESSNKQVERAFYIAIVSIKRPKRRYDTHGFEKVWVLGKQTHHPIESHAEKASEKDEIRMIVGMKYPDKPIYTQNLIKKEKNATCNTKYF